jgi:hypothetical protein
MSGILNPKGPFQTQTRPAHEVKDPDLDTWYSPCSSPTANDGTFWSAQDANMLLAQLRHAIRGMGVADNPLDDQMLLKAIQAAQTDIVALAANNPIYPAVDGGAGKLSVTGSTGQVVIDAGQDFVWRGLVRRATGDWDLADRTFVTSASKTYHLRCDTALTTFVLKDLADVGYNPTAAAETDAAFDSGFDDMLIARVVTDGANAPTVTALRNAHELRASIVWSGAMTTNQGSNGASRAFATTLDWARTPDALAAIGGVAWNNTAPTVDLDMSVNPAANRYGLTGTITFDNANSITVETQVIA